ncbi:hypothetical protein CcaCcLH18_12767 [Colletotrichum camelliae]|nr:hypothetical protein CcaCcLH18_12767 [Colletotrichum camelliae]
MNPSVTSKLAQFVVDLSLTDIPSTVRESAKSLILDTLGCLRGGARTPLARQINAVSKIFGGPRKASVAGCHEPAGTAQALYVNARLSNLLDLDETFPIGTHFGIGAVCAAIVALEARDKRCDRSDGEDLLVGVVAGYEIAARVATAIGPIIRVEDGQVKDYAQIWGVSAPVVIASCVAYAKVLGRDVVDSKTLEQAFGIALSNIPIPIGNRWSDSVEIADCKYCDAGWCAVTGMHGVMSALEGLTGFANIFDGEVGLADACGAEMPRPESLTEQLGKLWYLSDITFKVWPTCRWIQAPQTALQILLQKHHPAIEDIEEVVVFTNPVADGALFRNPAPSTFCGYSFSYPHAVAMMLLKVPPGAQWFNPEIAESATALKLRRIVRIEKLEKAQTFPQHMVRNQIRTMPGAVTVKTVHGDLWAEETNYSEGDPWDSCTKYDSSKVNEKFLTMEDSADAWKLLDWISDLESISGFYALSTFIRQSHLGGGYRDLET